MKKVLVLGGNHYFGIKLVQLLLKAGHDVTLLNRGNRDDGFGDKVKRIKCDRHNADEFKNAITQDYDIVFDQSCFDYDQAKLACHVFNGKVQKYIFTSSVSAYNEYGASIKESLFDPLNFSFEKKETMESNYGEAKRQAEVSFYKYAEFPVTAVRFPIVLDEDDATQRLQFHVRKVLEGKEIFFTNLESKIAFISANDAAYALYELSKLEFAKPINVASSIPISLKDCMGHIENIVGKKLKLASSRNDENVSPYNISEDWYIDCTLLKELGVNLSEIEEYLPKMIMGIKEKLETQS